jgi:hypothetical protein
MTGIGAGMGFPDIMTPARYRIVDWGAAVLPGVDEARQGPCVVAFHCEYAVIVKTNDRRTIWFALRSGRIRKISQQPPIVGSDPHSNLEGS